MNKDIRSQGNNIYYSGINYMSIEISQMASIKQCSDPFSSSLRLDLLPLLYYHNPFLLC